MSCKRDGKHQEYAQYLVCQVLTFLPPYGAPCLLDQYTIIDKASFLTLLLLSNRVPPYSEALN